MGLARHKVCMTLPMHTQFDAATNEYSKALRLVRDAKEEARLLRNRCDAFLRCMLFLMLRCRSNVFKCFAVAAMPDNHRMPAKSAMPIAQCKPTLSVSQMVDIFEAHRSLQHVAFRSSCSKAAAV